jgi:hypothetical protein
MASHLPPSEDIVLNLAQGNRVLRCTIAAA